MSQRLPRWLEYGSYLLVALGAVLPTLRTPGHVVGDGVDMYGTFWFYWWVGDCLARWVSPGFTDMMFFPLGKDIFGHTGNNFVDAVVAQPLVALFGFPSYQPWWVFVLLLGNGLAFRPLAREVLGRPFAAWGATLLWMICPYILFECMTGRFTQAMLWFLPLAVLHFLRIPQGDKKDAVLAGIWTAAQAWTYWFMGYFMALAFAWLAAVEFQRSSHRLALGRGYALAGLACLLGVAPAAIAMKLHADEGAVPGLADAPWSFSLLTTGPGQLGNNVAADLHGYALLETSGQPMLAYVVWGGGLLLSVFLARDRARWLGLTILLLVFSVGPVWAGPGPRLVLPWYMAAYHGLPFFDRLWFPYRMLSVAFLGITLLLGTLLVRAEIWAEVRKARGARAWPAWGLPVALVLGSMAEQAPNLAYPLLHRAFVPPYVYSWLHEQEGAIIELPIGLSRVSVAWQPVHERPVWGGMGENATLLWPEGFSKRQANSFIKFLKQVTRDPIEARAMKTNPNERLSLEKEGFRWVVMDRQLVDADIHKWGFVRKGGEEVALEGVWIATDLLVERLGQPVAADGALLVFDLKPDRPRTEVPSVLQPTPGRLNTRTWVIGDRPAYETRLIELDRLEEKAAPGAPRREGSRAQPQGEQR